MKRTIICLLTIAMMLVTLTGCQTTLQKQPSPDAAISFTDDDGRKIGLEKPSERIISLYSAHTENLYTLGVGDKVIGVHSTSVYPADAAFKDQFDYNADPEKVIAAEPDCVLIRPFISRKVPEFVQVLENAGVAVVSLYPETLADFDGYIEKLGLLTGTEDAAKQKLAEFHANLDAVKTMTANVPEKQKVFFESTEVNLRTTTPDSMAGLAIEMAGGENIAANAKPISEGSSIAAFGSEKILALADEIDVYISQRGAMNAGGNLHSITIRPGFDTIKAVRDGRVYVINEKLISSPTFRYYKGVRELARYLYPDLMDTLANYQTETPATKRDLANILVRAEHLPVYVTSSSKYYQQEHKGHVYGLFKDVEWQDSDFDYIETVAMAGAVGWENEGDNQFFRPDTPVTKEMLAKAIFILHDFNVKDNPTPISDLASCENPNIVQALVDNNIFTLSDGKFEPDKELTGGEIVQTLSQL